MVSFAIQFKLNKAVYKQIMWIAVRQAHLSVYFGLYKGPNKLTHPFKVLQVLGLFEPEDKKAWRGVGDAGE